MLLVVDDEDGDRLGPSRCRRQCPVARLIGRTTMAETLVSCNRELAQPDRPTMRHHTMQLPAIHPMRSLGLLSVAHAVNHAQAVLLPLIFLKIIDEFGVGVEAVAFLAAIGGFASGLVQLELRRR